MRQFVLEGRKVRTATLMEWAVWLETATIEEKRVAFTAVGGFEISTVFLGLDHNYSGEGPPVLWETMVFDANGVAHDFDCARCSGSWEQAEEMHDRMVRAVEAVCGIERTPHTT